MRTEEWMASTRARIDDGWLDILEAERRLGKITLSADPLPEVGPHELARRVHLEDDFDLIAAAREAISRDAEIAARQRAFDTVRIAKSELNNRRSVWMGNHQKQLCAALQEDRLEVQRVIRPLVKQIAPLREVTDLGRHPELAEAFAAVAKQIEIWSAILQLHKEITRLQFSHDGWERTGGVWPGLEFIASYTTAWPNYWRYMTHRRDWDGQEVGAVPPDWSAENVLATARAIARFDIWTPTSHEYEEATEHLTRAAYALHQRADHDYAKAAKAGFPTVGEPKPDHRRTIEAEPLPAHLGGAR